MTDKHKLAKNEKLEIRQSASYQSNLFTPHKYYFITVAYKNKPSTNLEIGRLFETKEDALAFIEANRDKFLAEGIKNAAICRHRQEPHQGSAYPLLEMFNNIYF